MGQGEGFEKYVEANWQRLVYSAMLMGCPHQDAEDVVQTALIRCYRVWERVESSDNLNAYIQKTVANVLRSSRKRFWNQEEPTEFPPDSSSERNTIQASVVEKDQIEAALLRLSPAHRQVLVLRFFADFSERDTAEILNVRPGTVKSRTARALALLNSHDELRQPREFT